MTSQLRPVQYRNYLQTVIILHYFDARVKLEHFVRSSLISHPHYNDSRIGPDPLRNVPVQEGDEIPDGCLEALYLPNVFFNKGSAVGFRRDGRIEWVCFSRPIDSVLATACDEAGKHLFDRVALLEKSGRSIKRNEEYHGLYQSVKYLVIQP